MKKKFHLALFLFLVLFTGLTFGQTDPSCSFYPLQTDDLWQYKISLKLNNSNVDTTYYATKQVLGDTLMSNGYHYKIVEEEDLYSTAAGVKVTRYLLVDSLSANVYEYDEGDLQQKGVLIDSLKCQQGDYFGEGYYYCEATGTDMILNYATEYKDILQNAPDLSTQHTLARDIGISYQLNNIQEGYGGTKEFNLIYANINGIIYGDFVNSIPAQTLNQAGFKLLANYPNPFNPVTQIRFRLPCGLSVKMDIFSSSGKKVYEFNKRYFSAGYHKVEFDAGNLSSGVYFCRLSGGNYSGVIKMMLLR